MNRNKFLWPISFLILFLNSCFYISNVPEKNRQNLIYCYQDKNTGIDSLININGYFQMGETPGGVYGFGKSVWKVDTNYTNYMFFKDGTFLCQFGDYHYPGNIPKYFQEVVENTKQGKSDEFYKGFQWGGYIICGDTIKAQYINHPHVLSDGWMSYEEWFKVIDKNTIKNIFKQSLCGDKRIIYDNKTAEDTKYTGGDKTYTLLPAKFISTPVVPSSDCWLKYKKWFWCDGNKYEEWKKKIEKK